MCVGMVALGRVQHFYVLALVSFLVCAPYYSVGTPVPGCQTNAISFVFCATTTMSMDNRLCGLVPVPMIRVGLADNPGRLNMHKTGTHSTLNRARKSDCLCILVCTKIR